jgi:sugar lactone lactonase YvrE
MSTFKTDLSGKSRPAALGLFVISFLAFLFIVVGGTCSSASATGPALWMAVPQQQPTPVGGSVGGVVELRPGQLRASGTPHQVQIESALAPLSNAAGLAFQQNGSLWVCTLSNQILKFTFGQLESLGVNPHPAPKVTITSTAFSFNIGCVLDSSGNLWVVDAMIDGVHEISHAQLVTATLKGGASVITPAVTITSTSLASPAFDTFDAEGNLWVTSEGNNNIVEFKANTLSVGGAKTPDVIITSPSVAGPGQPQFDAAGNLWVTNALNNTVVKFTPAHLGATGTPIADAIISNNGTSLVTPWGCAFDSLGRLWVFNYGTASSVVTTISMFGRGQLAANGASSPVPRITLSGLQPFAAQLTFGPRY